jgi:hypothetical protein
MIGAFINGIEDEVYPSELGAMGNEDFDKSFRVCVPSVFVRSLRRIEALPNGRPECQILLGQLGGQAANDAQQRLPLWIAIVTIEVCYAYLIIRGLEVEA